MRGNIRSIQTLGAFKRPTTTKLFLITAVLWFCSWTYGQNNAWTEYKTASGVKIEYKKAECHQGFFDNQAIVLLKFTNTNNYNVSISWFTERHRNNSCVNCHKVNDPENTYMLEVNANEIVAGDCEKSMTKNLYIFDHFIDKAPGMSDSRLTQFELQNIQVIKKEQE